MSAIDNFASNTPGLDSPATQAALVTPNDSTDLANVTRGVMLGSSGTLQVTMSGMTTAIEIQGLAAGIIHPIRVSRIWNTNTSATNIVAFW